MAATPTYAAYDYTACGAQIRSQSIVECRLSDWAQNRPLAVCPSVTLTDAEVRDGEDDKERTVRMKYNRQYIINSTLKGEHHFLDNNALKLN